MLCELILHSEGIVLGLDAKTFPHLFVNGITDIRYEMFEYFCFQDYSFHEGLQYWLRMIILPS